MDSGELIGLVIGGIAVVGGLAIGGIAIVVSVPWVMKEKLAKLDIRNKERIAMLEKGIDPTIIFKESKGAGQDPMLWGLLLAGMGLGIFLGYMLYLITKWDRIVLTNSLGVLFSGIGLIIYSLYRKASGDQYSA